MAKLWKKNATYSLENMVVLFLIVFFLQTSFMVAVSAFSTSPLVAFFFALFLLIAQFLLGWPLSWKQLWAATMKCGIENRFPKLEVKSVGSWGQTAQLRLHGAGALSLVLHWPWLCFNPRPVLPPGPDLRFRQCHADPQHGHRGGGGRGRRPGKSRDAEKLWMLRD